MPASQRRRTSGHGQLRPDLDTRATAPLPRPGLGVGNRARRHGSRPAAVTRSWAASRSLTRTSKCTPGTGTVCAGTDSAPEGTPLAMRGCSSVTQPGYRVGVPPSSPAQKDAWRHGSALSSTTPRIHPITPSSLSPTGPSWPRRRAQYHGRDKAGPRAAVGPKGPPPCAGIRTCRMARWVFARGQRATVAG
jgi:hypothetical protein